MTTCLLRAVHGGSDGVVRSEGKVQEERAWKAAAHRSAGGVQGQHGGPAGERVKGENLSVKLYNKRSSSLSFCVLTVEKVIYNSVYSYLKHRSSTVWLRFRVAAKLSRTSRRIKLNSFTVYVSSFSLLSSSSYVSGSQTQLSKTVIYSESIWIWCRAPLFRLTGSEEQPGPPQIEEHHWEATFDHL